MTMRATSIPVDNKRLGRARFVAKTRQQLALPLKGNTTSEKLRYQKRRRQIYGPDYVPKIPVKSAKKGPTLGGVKQVG